MPCGTFVLRTSDRPIVLIGAGIGCTPMLSMLETLVKSKTETGCTQMRSMLETLAKVKKSAKVTFIHCVKNSEHHCFAQDVDELIQDVPSFQSHAFYSSPTSETLSLNKTQVHPRKMKKEDLVDLLEGDLKKYEYYVCGPKGFIDFILNVLNEFNVSQEQISFEHFGPQLQ